MKLVFSSHIPLFRRVAATGVCLISYVALSSAGTLWMPSVFGDNMVLQRGESVRFWGKSAPSSTVNVKAGTCKGKTVADVNGCWSLSLDMRGQDNEAFEIQVSSDGEKLKFSNVIMGDVWLASGQSNMELRMNDVNDAKSEIEKADNPEIRFFNVATNISRTPIDDVKGRWEICTPSVAGSFSGVAYYFASELNKGQHTPVGIISSSWGGTPIEAWTSSSMLKIHPDFYSDVLAIENDTADWSSLYADYKKQWNDVRQSNTGDKQGVDDIDYDDSSWKTVSYPMNVWSMGLGYFGGFFWIRNSFDWNGSDSEGLRLCLGTIYGDAEVYLNGEMIGKGSDHLSPTMYDIKTGLLRHGKNTIAIRHCSFWGTGRVGNGNDKVCICDASGNNVLTLSDKWKMSASIEKKFPSFPAYNDRPGALYNAMINPFAGYTMKGILWYQGENNASRASQYCDLMPRLIYDWRIRFGQGNLPFIYVQLANFREPKSFDMNDDWAYLRDAQSNTLRVENTGMAVIIDVGDAKDIHPRDKKTVGERLYRYAQSLAYGDKTVATGPLYKDYKVSGSEIILNFINPNSTLAVKSGTEAEGFYIAGKDRVFHKADNVRIVGNTVSVSSEKVSEPVAVRYAWASNPICNVCNTDGVPLSPFRTDNWKQDKNVK